MSMYSKSNQLLNSITHKINRNYTYLFLLMICLLVTCIYGVRQLVLYKNLNEKILTITNSILLLDNSRERFINYERYSSDFFKNYYTNTLVKMDSELNTTKVHIINLQNEPIIKSLEYQDSINVLSNEIDNYKEKLGQMISIYYQRGFDDYGLEGSLRSVIHKLENSNFVFDKVSMLMLRRHEKDFFIRKELKYIDKFDSQFERFSTSIPLKNKANIIPLLDDYKLLFHKIVNAETILGLDNKSGYKYELDNKTSLMKSKMDLLHSKVQDKIINLLLIDQIVVGLLIIVIFTSSILLMIRTKNSVSTKVNELNKHIYSSDIQKNKDSQQINELKEYLKNLQNKELDYKSN